jgi:hypothetical protein
MSYEDERTYQKLLAPLGEAPAVWADCMFADPIADLAVLGPPDDQELSAQNDAYRELVDSLKPLRIAAVPQTEEEAWVPAWLLSLEGKWFGCKARYRRNGSLWVAETTEPIRGGMSGSPVVIAGGKAIGVVSSASESPDETPICQGEYGSKNPRLTRDLPGWLLPTRKRIQVGR